MADSARESGAGAATPVDGDEALMQAYAAGDAGAFDRLYARHRGPLYRYVLRQVRDAQAAEELFQDVWMNAIRARASYAPTAKFTTWLYTLAHNRVVDHWRQRGSVVLESLDEGGDDGESGTAAWVESLPASRTDEPETRVSSRATGARIRAALDALPPAQREAFVLHVESELALADIARITGEGVETIKSRVRYAYAKLRSALGDLG